MDVVSFSRCIWVCAQASLLFGTTLSSTGHRGIFHMPSSAAAYPGEVRWGGTVRERPCAQNTT